MGSLPEVGGCAFKDFLGCPAASSILSKKLCGGCTASIGLTELLDELLVGVVVPALGSSDFAGIGLYFGLSGLS